MRGKTCELELSSQMVVFLVWVVKSAHDSLGTRFALDALMMMYATESLHQRTLMTTSIHCSNTHALCSCSWNGQVDLRNRCLFWTELKTLPTLVLYFHSMAFCLFVCFGFCWLKTTARKYLRSLIRHLVEYVKGC